MWPQIQRKGRKSLDFALWNYIDIIAAAEFCRAYYTGIIENYTLRFARRVRGLSPI